MADQPVVLILGAGPRVGASVAAAFAAKGYTIATASRKGTGSKDANGHLSLQADFTKPETIPALFDTVKAELGAAPSVVVYNAGALTPPPEQSSVLSIPASSVIADLNTNTVSAWVAAQQAVLGWETLPKETKKSFIYTGNRLNTIVLPVPMMLTLGMGKSASAYWVGAADMLYSKQGYRFFYADERDADGGLAGAKLDGPAHGEFFVQLASHEGDIPWHCTFTKGKGYVKY